MNAGRARVCCVADPDAVAHAAAGEIAEAASRAVEERGRFTIALAGGSTPRRLYRLLGDSRERYRERIRWDAVHLFFGDERHVPPEHPDSNYRMVAESLLANVAPASVHRIEGELRDAAAAAARYEADLARSFGLDPAREPPPRFDVVLLGLGRDGHTASLFPGSPALSERRRWVVAPFVAHLRAHRVTLTLPVLCRARRVLFVVAGAEKAQALASVLAPEDGVVLPPAAQVVPDTGAPSWIVDRAAAGGPQGGRPPISLP